MIEADRGTRMLNYSVAQAKQEFTQYVQYLDLGWSVTRRLNELADQLATAIGDECTKREKQRVLASIRTWLDTAMSEAIVPGTQSETFHKPLTTKSSIDEECEA